MAETTKTETTNTVTTTTASAEQPKAERPAFSFPVERKFTGKIQFRTNGPAEVYTIYGTTLRGEVKAVKSEKLAAGLVENGDHAHVPADTPVGQPEQFKATAKSKQAVPGVVSKVVDAIKSGLTGSAMTTKDPAGTGSAATDANANTTK